MQDTLELRGYQRTAVDAVMSGWEQARRQLIVMPTGTGKTVVFAKVAEAMRPQGPTLILAHREELLSQAREKIAHWTSLTTALERGDARADDLLEHGADVVVASVQTLSRHARLERFAPDAFALVVIDEAHHAPAATYQRILAHFDARVLGVTATPDRLDKQALGKVFDQVPFAYELRDAVEDGWLVPIRQKIVRIRGLDLRRVRTTAGDFNEGDLAQALVEHDVPEHVARATTEAAGERKTLVFAATIEHAETLAVALEQFTDPSRVLVLSGEDTLDARREGLRRFAKGAVQFLVNCMLFTEGFDLPEIDCVAMARPTKSRALYAQMIGRGTRTAAGKHDLLVIDFAGNSGRHTLVNVLDVLGGADDEISKHVMHQAEAEDGCDVLDEMRRQQAALAEQYRRHALEAARRARAAQLEYIEVDPFRRVYSILKVRPIAGRMGGLAPTSEQLEELRRYKVDFDISLGSLDRGQAMEILARIKERPRQGLATYKQARVLLKFGFDPDVPFEKAREIIDQLAANDWRRPLVTATTS
jgi:superfamily II DNA or RNA helicase